MQILNTEINELTTCLHVGITGHRDIASKDLPRIQTQLRDVLDTIKEIVNELHREQRKNTPQVAISSTPILRLISSLAEGADRMAAHAALELGYELQCPLPFDKEYYKTTFSGGKVSCDEFDELLGKSSAVLEIAIGNKQNSGQGYADAAAVLIDHSDVLIALSDGAPSALIAGTYATIRQALRRCIPVIVIPCSRNGKDARPCYTDNKILFLAGSHGREQNGAIGKWKEQLKEHLRNVLILDKQYGRELSYLLPGDVSPAAEGTLSPSDMLIPRTGIEWAKYKTYYSSVAGKAAAWFRKGLLCKQVSPIFAYLFLALSTYCGIGLGNWLYAPQIFFLFLPIMIFIREYSARKHRIFLRMRTLAELCRISSFLAPIGYCNVSYRHRAYKQDNNHDTPPWFYRSLMRCAGLPSGCMTRQTCSTWLSNFCLNFVNKQIAYHDKRFGLGLAKLTWYSRIAFSFFVIGVICALMKALVFLLPACLVGTIGVLYLVSPAIGVLFSSFAAYVSVSANPSTALCMRNSLNAVKEDILHLTGKADLSYTDILSLCESVDEICRDEISDWVDSTSSGFMRIS